MAKKFSDLRSRMAPQAQARAAVKAQAMLAEMPLNELRQARGLSQKMLAEVLHVGVPRPNRRNLSKPVAGSICLSDAVRKGKFLT